MLTFVRSNPSFSQLQRELDQALESPSMRHRPSFAPIVDIEETDTSFLLQADVPGMSEETIEIIVEDNALLLRGSRSENPSEENRGNRLRERKFGSFERRFKLGTNIDQENIAASYKNGVLTVRLPKSGSAKPRQIPVAMH